MKLNYGNLLEMAKNGDFDVIIHGANAFHTMGAGIAKYIKQDFPEAYEADKKTVYGDKNKIGTFSEALIERNGHKFVVINAYTQFRFGGGVDNFEYDSFPKLLQSIKEKYGDKRIGLPLIGCGLAGGDEPRILKMIKENFEGVDYKLVELDKNRKLKIVENTENSSNIQEEKQIITFTKVSLPNGWMSNMAPYPVIYNNVTYKTTEALFQCLRFENYPEIQKEIMNEKSPMAAKMIAKGNRDILVKDGYEFLGNKDLELMRLCINLKLEQHPQLKDELLATGNKKIIEDCSARPQDSGLFWGCAYQNGTWIGKNSLGEILMEKRLELQNQLENKKNMEYTKPEYTFFFHLTSPFSNFHPAKFEYKELTFISNEQFMMYSKAKTFKDEETAEKIMNIHKQFSENGSEFKNMEDKIAYQIIHAFKNGKINSEQILKDKESVNAWNNIHKKIKQLGREVKGYDDEIWSRRRFKVVLFGAREKFNQNYHLKDVLINTGNTKMVEASPYDKIWGIGLSEYDAKRIPEDKWPGENLLGQVLDELKIEYNIILQQNNIKKKIKP